MADANGAPPSSPLHVVVFPWLAFGHMIPFLELSKRLARRGHAVTFVSTPRNAARLGAVPPELSARLRIVTLDLPELEGLPEGAESTADVPPEKIELLKKAFDGLAASFRRLVVESWAGGDDVAATVRRVMVEEEGETLARNAMEMQKVVGGAKQMQYVDELVEYLQRYK